MTIAVQQSLFEPARGAPIVESVRWIESMLLGDIALGMLVVSVAFVGLLMLSGRLPLHEGARVVLGCFVLLGAPVIAAGFIGDGENASGKAAQPPPPAVPFEPPRAPPAPPNRGT